MFFHPKCFVRTLYSAPVLLVLLTVASVYYCYIKGFLTVVSLESAIVPAVLFHLTFVLGLWSYIKALTTDPGSIPSYFDQISYEIIDMTDILPEDISDSKSTTCLKCNLKRPPRTHHCSNCKRCILRMDHHCPWVGNCVGFRNQRFFIQFLIYSCASTLNYAFSCLGAMQLPNYPTQSLVGLITGFLFAVSIGGLGIFHIYLASTNQTTLEIKQKKKYNVFNTLNAKENISQLFGTRVLGYFLPIDTGYSIEGLSYPVRLRKLKGEVVIYSDKLIG